MHFGSGAKLEIISFSFPDHLLSAEAERRHLVISLEKVNKSREIIDRNKKRCQSFKSSWTKIGKRDIFCTFKILCELPDL